VAPASPDHLIQLAEKQLHLAKQDGRNRIHFAVLATLPA
jgi:PleD family two-component response regulator